MRFFRNIKLSAILVLVFIASGAYSQKLKKELTNQDVTNIYAQADLTLKSYFRHLNVISDPTLAENEVDEAIENQFTGDNKIFFSKTFEVDDDTNPDNTTSGSSTKEIGIYLRQFRNNYKQEKDNSISFEITERSRIKVGQNLLYVKIFYNQTNKGKSRTGKSYPKKIFKVAELQIVQLNKSQYKTYISALDFADKTASDNASNDVQITDAGQSADNGSDKVLSDGYYSAMLQKGTRLSKDGNFVAAYYALKEAKGGNAETEAENQLRQMMAKMRSLQLDVNESLSGGLVALAVQMDQKYRYAEAKKYYNYAKEVNPSMSKDISAAIILINDKQQKEQQFFTMLDKGAYSEAIQGFSAAVKKDRNNPNLYIGMARGFEMAGDYASAEGAFKDALKASPDYPETYKWMGYYYKNRKDFEHAYEAFVNYQIKAEDKSDNIIQSEIASCKGISLYNKRDFVPAMDSLKAAVVYNPNNKVALLYQSIIFKNNKDLESARKVIMSLIKLDEKDADAHYNYGQIILASVDAGNVNEYRKRAIEEFKLAISYNPKNTGWYYDLGNIQMDVNDYENAILNFTACINSAEKTFIQKLALWKRGKCYFITDRIEEASNDYTQFTKVAATIPPAFYVDYGNLLIRQKKYTEALEQLNQAKANKEALLSIGVATYLSNPVAEDVYLRYFEQAFNLGVSVETVKGNSTIRDLYDHNKRFKTLLKSYKYYNSF